MDDIGKWRSVYRLLNKVNTEVFDCGTLCGNACCMAQGGEEEMGIYLFPGEHLLLQAARDCPITRSPQSSLPTFARNLSHSVADAPTSAPSCDECLPKIGKQILRKEFPDSLAPGNDNWLEWETQDPFELGFPDSWTEPVYFVKCKTAPFCPRHLRPLQCRTFPLKPVFGDNGVLELIWNDEELPYVCPIIEKNMPIHDDFYKATYTVWTHLLRDRRIFDLIMQWSR